MSVGIMGVMGVSRCPAIDLWAFGAWGLGDLGYLMFSLVVCPDLQRGRGRGQGSRPNLVSLHPRLRDRIGRRIKHSERILLFPVAAPPRQPLVRTRFISPTSPAPRAGPGARSSFLAPARPRGVAQRTLTPPSRFCSRSRPRSGPGAAPSGVEEGISISGTVAEHF